MTLRHKVAVSLFLLISYAQAGMVVELVPNHSGPYFGGESLTVDVWFHSQAKTDLWSSSIQLDFSNTNPAITLDTNFTFDTSYMKLPGAYRSSPNLPLPWTYRSIACDCPIYDYFLSSSDPLHFGSIELSLPEMPGMYLLDVLNADDPDPDFSRQGAVMFVYDYFSYDSWSAYAGDITGGTYAFHVVPEPSTLILFVVGAGVGFIRHRRSM